MAINHLEHPSSGPRPSQSLPIPSTPSVPQLLASQTHFRPIVKATLTTPFPCVAGLPQTTTTRTYLLSADFGSLRRRPSPGSDSRTAQVDHSQLRSPRWGFCWLLTHPQRHGHRCQSFCARSIATRLDTRAPQSGPKLSPNETKKNVRKTSSHPSRSSLRVCFEPQPRVQNVVNMWLQSCQDEVSPKGFQTCGYATL